MGCGRLFWRVEIQLALFKKVMKSLGSLHLKISEKERRKDMTGLTGPENNVPLGTGQSWIFPGNPSVSPIKSEIKHHVLFEDESE